MSSNTFLLAEAELENPAESFNSENKGKGIGTGIKKRGGGGIGKPSNSKSTTSSLSSEQVGLNSSLNRQDSGDGGGGSGRKLDGDGCDVDIKDDRSKITLWRSPLKTLYYFVLEIPCWLMDIREKFVTSLSSLSVSEESPIDGGARRSIPVHRRALIFLVLLGILYGFYFIALRDDPGSLKLKQDIAWYSYWVFLGILSSVGLGTGLHTFLLYLSPFIAKVTLAAQECGSVQFPRPPYPDQLLCPDESNPAGVTVSDIMGKIRWESLMWGFGTALGELPPYFMARAARTSGMSADEANDDDDDDNEDLAEFNQLLERKKLQKSDPSNSIKNLSLMERGKLRMQELVEKVGFWGILACASIPNPLFDLAGITCGHFLVPFTTFFGATVIGKAIVKAHLQTIFVILVFNEELLDRVVYLLHTVPKLGPFISGPFVDLMKSQKSTLHSRQGIHEEGGNGLVASILETLVMGMVIYFIISIINAMAQSYHKRMRMMKARKSKSSKSTKSNQNHES